MTGRAIAFWLVLGVVVLGLAYGLVIAFPPT